MAVTGGTGFVGSHTVAALVGAGHTVRLLVRNPARIASALGPLGVDVGVEHVSGDVADAEAIESLLRGCDAVIHAASVYSFDQRRLREMRTTNVAGTETVLGMAHRLGLDPIVHVSSFVALCGDQGKSLHADSEPTTPRWPYSRSKADSERVARNLQARGAPVAITYPGQVLGPHDPHWGEGPRMLENALKGGFRFAPMGRLPCSDVRETARLHAALIESGKGPRRYMAPSVNLTAPQIIGVLNAATGRKLKTTTLPYGALRLPLSGFEALQRVVPWRLPLSHEPAWIMTRDHAIDDSATRADLGIECRPFEETLVDQIRWMVGTGRLRPKLAGRLGQDKA